MADRASLRLSSTLIFVGLLFIIAVGLFHAEGGPANDHVLAFTAYAKSAAWTPVHLGQFVGILITVAGLLALHFSLEPAGRLQRYAAATAVVALALYGALQAIDGVTLKQASLAWFQAPEAEKTARFAAAEAVRWAEWGLRSYFSFVFGLALILFGFTLARSRRVASAIGYLMALTGLAYLIQGFVVGSVGFDPRNDIPTLAGYATWLIWSLWFLIASWRTNA